MPTQPRWTRSRPEFPDFIAARADVTDEAQMDAFLRAVEAEWGGVDVVCANAGTGGPAGRIEDLDYAAWRDCVGVNLFGAFLTCRVGGAGDAGARRRA